MEILDVSEQVDDENLGEIVLGHQGSLEALDLCLARNRLSSSRNANGFAFLVLSSVPHGK